VGTVIFFILAVLIIGYYGVTLSLHKITNLYRKLDTSFLGQTQSGEPPSGRLDASNFLNDFEKTLNRVKEKVDEIESNNLDLSSKFGSLSFEKDQLTDVLNSLNFGIILTDNQDNISYVNDYFLRLIHRNKTEVIDRSLPEVIDHAQLLSFISEQDNIKRSGNDIQMETHFPDLAPDQTFRVSLTYLEDRQGTVIGKVISVNNVTREKRAETAQADFIAHVSHELMSPLTNIKAYNEMLMDGEIEGADTQRDFYNTINQETDRLSNLIRNLLNISKIEIGGLTLSKGLVKTDWFMEDCIRTIEASARDKNISIETVLPDTFPSILADKELLKNAVINILSNALKYTPENGQITFSITDHEKIVTFDILDTGFGIAEEDLPRIFDKFFRASDSNISEQTGSGLGLAITSEIVHLHDGEIEVKSAPGEGTQVTIKIPKEEFYLDRA